MEHDSGHLRERRGRERAKFINRRFATRANSMGCRKHPPMRKKLSSEEIQSDKHRFPFWDQDQISDPLHTLVQSAFIKLNSE